MGNPACLLFALRAGIEGLPVGSKRSVSDEGVWYGHIGPLGELVHESELEVIGD